MTGKEFAPDGVPITEKVTQHYATTGNAQVEVPGIGLVSLDRQAVKSSLFHGIGRDKATAFAAVPDVLKNGKIIHAEAMEGARDAGMVRASEIGRAVQQECRDRSRMPSSA
eukprot:TRINITY_DN90285_c0_g1_i1.p2 TRINITY_DN90285_c0_g1~~TRINITY_DN90285_c0_g1_i1.p2  ORF type:complete len:111 (+),score=27.26 TRINITY_DN90285_c0_g1_i1:74-406(+)